jgi:hypothetical protein
MNLRNTTLRREIKTSYQDDATQRRTQTMKSQQKKATKMVNLCENHLFRLKARKKTNAKG